MKQILSIITLTCVLTGCAQTQDRYEDAFVVPNSIHRSEMSMVVTKVNVPYKNVLNKPSTYNGFIVIRELNTNTKYKIDGSSYENSISMIKPGLYQIDSVQWTDGAYNYGFVAKDAESNNISLQLGGFNIKPGECLYLGNIEVNRNSVKTENAISISNHTNEMQASLRANHNLEDNLITKLKFYSLLTKRDFSKNNDGTYNIGKGKKND